MLGAVYRLQRRHGFYYGDSSIWVRREVFDALGGYREIPIMDDYDFVRRLERSGTTRCLPGPATTSARRWRSAGIARTVLAWFVIRWLFVAGVAPAAARAPVPRGPLTNALRCGAWPRSARGCASSRSRRAPSTPT